MTEPRDGAPREPPKPGRGPMPVVHLELHTADGAGARAFYSELLGWRSHELRHDAGAYVSLELGSVGGGVVECGTERALWLPYAEVADIVAATRHARRLGAEMLLEPREGPGGWRSVVRAPGCGEIALWEPKRGR